MTEARGWGLVNAVLGVVLVLLLAAAAFLVAAGPGTAPATAAAQQVSDEYAAVTAAAEQETTAFLTVDYRRLDATEAQVLAGATGRFRTEYAKAEAHLRAAARRNRVKSSGTVRAVGVGHLDADSAVVYVAADSTVSNKSTRHKPQSRYYRLRLDLAKVGGSWRTADLTFVP